MPDRLFIEMRDYLRDQNHHYADKHQYGEGPSWRLRTIRAALGKLEINDAVLKHGIRREVYFCPLASNAIDILRSDEGKPRVSPLLTIAKIADLAKERWIVPRAERRPEFKVWRREHIRELIGVDSKRKGFAVRSA